MRFACAFAAMAVLAAGAARADDLVLTSRDGAIELSGTLVGFDGEVFRIDTVYGVLSVDAAGVACEGAACPDPAEFAPDISIGGSPIAGEGLIPDMIETFAAANGLKAVRETGADGGVAYALFAQDGARLGRFVFALSTSEQGYLDLAAGVLDIAITFGAVSAVDQQMIADLGSENLVQPRRARVVALDALVPIVAQQNPLGSVTLAQMSAILAGQISDWSALGGPDGAITLHLRDQQAGIIDLIEEQFAVDDTGFPQSVRRHSSNDALADAIAGDPLALGITSISDIGSARALRLGGSCGFSSGANATSVKSEDYPLTTPHFLYTPPRRLPRLARDFLAFAQSPEAQAVVRRAGFVDQSISAQPLAAQGDRMVNAILNTGQDVALRDLRDLAQNIQGSRRLSPTFRFEDGSADLDAQSQSNIVLLADAIARGDLEGETLIFAGFSDGVGAASRNRDLSRRRAEAVRDAVVAAAPDLAQSNLALLPLGFGEALPMACDDEVWGRKVNRRVELWLR